MNQSPSNSQFGRQPWERRQSLPAIRREAGWGATGDELLRSLGKVMGLGGKGGADAGNAFAPPVQQGDVISPASMIAIGDSIHSNTAGLLSDGDAQLGIYFWATERIAGSHDRSLRRHDGRGNFVFCDGHVGEHKLEGLFFKLKTEQAKLWNRDNSAHLNRLKRESSP